ncbi:MAG: ammonium transporter, partial [Pseudomonadota bacterium]|nr:ammonium transporter [Pseudomonadota bacterium]
ASIVSGTVAERIKLWPFLGCVVLLTAFIYPIQASWVWGGGWLSAAGFSDFAGSTLVHSVGGWAALVGAILLGARAGKYGADGSVTPIPGSSMPLATLGTFILWLGWFGFNGGSQLAMGTVSDVADVSRIFANTNAAAAGGSIAALILTQIFYKKVDLTMVLNGALAGLVSITAEPLTPTLGAATLIGGIGGVIVVFTVPLLDKLRIDDVVGAIPVHLIAGIWGTIAVALTNSDDFSANGKRYLGGAGYKDEIFGF